MEKIFSGADRARELGFKTYRAFVIALSKKINLEWDESMDENPASALNAFVTNGRWAVTCECGESYYVEPSDPFGYCYGKCGNAMLGGRGRVVIFPPEDERAMIETVLLERELEGVPTAISRLGTQAVLAANIIYPKILPRNWDGQTIEELRQEHNKVSEILNELKAQKDIVGLEDELPAPDMFGDHLGRAERVLDEIREQRKLMEQEREETRKEIELLEKERKEAEAERMRLESAKERHGKNSVADSSIG